MHETRDRTRPKTILVGVDFGLPHFDSGLQELGLLAQTAGLDPVERVTCKRKAPDPALFVGSGKADEIKALAVAFTKAAELGGTWRDNSYPGCACDIPSHLYSFSFEPNPDWSEMYAPQQEIRHYLERCADNVCKMAEKVHYAATGERVILR